MATTAANLGTLLCTNSQIEEITRLQIHYSNLYTKNSEKLQAQVKYEEKWESEYDKAGDGQRSTALKMDNEVYLDKEVAGEEWQCEEWANYKVSEYDEELSLELSDLDVEYETMKDMYDTLLQELNAQKDSEKQLVSSSAQDTGLLE